MPLEITNEEFTDVFQEKDLTVSVLTKIGAYLQKNKSEREFKELGRYLQSGNYRLSGFTCREDVIDSLMQNLYEKHIAFILVQNTSGEYGLLIKTEDENNALHSIEETLKQKAKYVKLLDGEAFRMALAGELTSDKDILFINGLELAELLRLTDIMQESYNGLGVGVEKYQDGKYSLLLHAKSVMKKKRDLASIMALSVENSIALNGANAIKNQKIARDNVEILRFVSVEDFGRTLGEQYDLPTYIYGGRKQYIRIKDGAFEYGKMEDGIFNAQETLPVNGNENILKARIGAIPNRRISTSIETLEAFSAEQKTNKIDAGEKAIAHQIDIMVSKKLQYSLVMREEGRWSGKFQTYIREAADTLEAFAAGRIPEGYTREQMSDLNNIAEYYGLNPQDYSIAASAIRATESKSEPAKVITAAVVEQPQKDALSFSTVRADVDREAR